MKATVSVRRSGSALTLRCGRYRESFDTTFMGPFQLADSVRWSLITSGLSLPQETVDRILREAGLLAEEAS